MMPEKVDNVQDTLEALKSVVDLNDDDIAAFKKERARSHRFTSIPVKTNLTEVQVARFAVNQYRFPGVEVKAISVATTLRLRADACDWLRFQD
jgi:penicillin-binding protein 2